MTVSTDLVALDPIDARTLFNLGCNVARTGRHGQSVLLNKAPGFDKIQMYQACLSEGQEGFVHVFYPAAGGVFGLDSETDDPTGYARLSFGTGWFEDDDLDADAAEAETWRHHAGLVASLGQLLDARGIRWTWSFEEDPWIEGHVPAERPQLPGNR
jgi:hypothetical protein